MFYSETPHEDHLYNKTKLLDKTTFESPKVVKCTILKPCNETIIMTLLRSPVVGFNIEILLLLYIRTTL